MNGRQILGAAMLLALFAAFTGWAIHLVGWEATLIVYAFTVAVAAFLSLAVSLLMDDLP
tara:strand:- start:830 stop:1006 length:177 start_codon:yes stop_codon:yes gene_type:complete